MPKRLLPDPDLETLIQRLNSAAKTAPAEATAADQPVPAGEPDPERRRVWKMPPGNEDGIEWMGRLLADAKDAHASDLLIVPGTPPMIRVYGRLRALGEQALTPGASGLLCAALLPDLRRPAVESKGTLDFVISRPGVGRLRCNVHRQRDHWAAAVRLLPELAPDLDELNLPESLKRFADLEHGLVLVTGPTGSGKSTTMAALVRRILSRRQVHVVTIEDPVEYDHPHGESVVEHIEVGRDTPSFAVALRSALRQDPDVLLIGEMRDPESIGIAITAAETGHLVLATLHTGDAAQTIHRILDSYPAEQLDLVRVQLSVSLAGVISQQLLPRSDDEGRVPAAEVLIATNSVRNLVRQGKIAQLRSQITLETQSGMLSLDRSLASLAKRGLVDRDEARARSRIPEEFDGLMKRKDLI